MEKFLKLLVLAPYFYFLRWIEKVDRDSRYFTFFYYFYWIYLPLWALFSIAFTGFSVLLFNYILLSPRDLTRWGICLLLIFLSLVNDWKVFDCLKKMNKLRLDKKKASNNWGKVSLKSLAGKRDFKGANPRDWLFFYLWGKRNISWKNLANMLQ